MALTRLYIDDKIESGCELTLGRDRAHYVGRVLRLRPGDTLTVFNGDDGEFAANLVSLGKHDARLTVDAHLATATESPLKTHLVQGVSRGERMDFVVQKATELGVKRITPVLTKHGVVRLDSSRAARRREHWQRIAESACAQSGRIRPPMVDEPLPLNDWFGARTDRSDIDLILQPRAATALTSISAPRTKVCLLIGPEGGFSHREYDDAHVAGFKSVSLGPRLLRTETAAVAALAIAQSLWGDLRVGDGT